MPITCLPLTEGEVAPPPFSRRSLQRSLLMLEVSVTSCRLKRNETLSLCDPPDHSLSGCPLNAQSIKKKHSEEEMMTIKLKTSSGEPV